MGDEIEPSAQEFQHALEQALQRYLVGANAIVAARDIPVGLTPKVMVWALNKAKLYRYQPLLPPEKRYPVPLLLVYALINKPYIFDLRPGRSFVEFMLQQGFDVYLLDWGPPGPEDRKMRLDDYAGEYLPRAVRKLLHLSGAREFSVLGYCIGALLTVLYAAQHPTAPIRNIVLLAPPLDFGVRNDSLFSIWLDEKYFDVDKLVDRLGNIPAQVIEVASKMLKPVENYVGAYETLMERLDKPEAKENWQAMHKWVHDGVPFAGEAFRQWVKELVRENRLIKGELVIKGQPVNLANIRASFLDVVAEADHLVPLSESLSVLDAIASQDKQLLKISAGHVGLMGGGTGKRQLWPRIAAWLAERSSVTAV
jgi:poly[(R)-3-hydroxyalkanoate] polymerase subunit PhaC